mgnify:CR=1 FL=1
MCVSCNCERLLSSRAATRERGQEGREERRRQRLVTFSHRLVFFLTFFFSSRRGRRREFPELRVLRSILFFLLRSLSLSLSLLSSEKARKGDPQRQRRRRFEGIAPESNSGAREFIVRGDSRRTTFRRMRPPHERPSVLGEVPKSPEGTGAEYTCAFTCKNAGKKGVETRGGGETISPDAISTVKKFLLLSLDPLCLFAFRPLRPLPPPLTLCSRE